MNGESRRPVRVGVVDQGKPQSLHYYLDAVRRAGGEVTLLHWQDETRDPVADARAFDAVLLCGGDDVDPVRFGEETHPSVTVVPARRDEYEIAFVRSAVEAGVPVLGICRGGQVLNVALGGTLEQHVPDVPGRSEHRGGTSHDVEILPGTKLAALAGKDPHRGVVNSYHHQAVGKVAPGLRVAARAADGVVEAVEGEGTFCIGVQWHPERQGTEPALGDGLFAALVEAGGKKGVPAKVRTSKKTVGRRSAGSKSKRRLTARRKDP